MWRPTVAGGALILDSIIPERESLRQKNPPHAHKPLAQDARPYRPEALIDLKLLCIDDHDWQELGKDKVHHTHAKCVC
jgi:hypothetical protein